MSQLTLPVSEPSVDDPVMDEAAESAAFDEGYAGTLAPPSTETTPPVVETTPEVVVTPVEPAPDYVQITKAEWTKMLADTGSVTEIKQEIAKRFDTTFGKMGSLEHTLTQLQHATPIGQPITVSEEDLAELKADGFPDLTASLAKGLTRVLSKFKGTGAPAPIDLTAQVEPLVQQRIQSAHAEWEAKLAIERLTDLHPDWREIAGPKDSQTDYRTWLATQPDGATVLESSNPREVAKSLTRFIESKKVPEPTPKPTGRSQRLAEAVPARGGSGAAPVHAALSEDDEFEKGFKTSR